ncbi:MAG: hypothetical protein Q7T74_07450 [Candidatus Saccharibacteria bacterium]|nr:hypothetical protein [Candidatus Saccharibacteria bacterium]
MNTLKQHLEVGKPFAMPIKASEQAAIVALGEVVEATSLEAHKQMYQAYERGDSSVTVFTDDPREPEKYISFVDRNGEPCYNEFVAGNSATDIGIRGVNPEFDGVINPTTVIHADKDAVHDFREKGAPQVVVKALDAARLFNNFIIERIARPYLRQVALENEVNPDEYLQHFYPFATRPHTLTRVIMYHIDAKDGMRPVGETDGVPLLIKQHNDKSAYTIDSVQTSSGLQYYDLETREWVNAGTEVACFRGSAESFLPTAPPPTAHRVVFEEDLREKASPRLLKAKVGRMAIPTFICPVNIGDRQTIKSDDIPQTTSVAI